MRRIIVGFSRPKKFGIFAKLIMWVDKIPYSHVYIKWHWNGIGRDIIYQASKFAVNFESNITFDGHALSVEEYEVDISDDCHKKMMQFCMDNANKPYGFKEILGFAWVKIVAKFGKKIRNPFPSNGSSFVCSTLGAEILQITDILDDSVVSEDIDPKDLNGMVKSLNLNRVK